MLYIFHTLEVPYEKENTMTIYNYSLQKKDGSELSLKAYENKVLIIVNTASKCGFTPQYEGLEKLYKTYKEQGLEIIAVPSNQFAEEEPGSNEDIQHFCKLNYGVSFLVASKADVRDEQALPLFKFLTKEQSFKGFPPAERTEPLKTYLEEHFPHYLTDESIKWNFTKFLINKKGQVVDRFEPVMTPEAMIPAIEKLLTE